MDGLDAYRDDYGADLVDRALKRDIVMTKYGWRVAWNLEMDGDWELQGDKPRAYWPRYRDGKMWCRCRFGRSGRMCSHILAVLIKEGI